ncbi:hypothetical protein Tco_0155889 [Tanacetum coccineum]
MFKHLMTMNEYSDVKAEGVADNLMPDVLIKERFDDAEDYKVDGDPYLYFSPDRISLDENGIHYKNDAAEDDFSSVKRLKMNRDCPMISHPSLIEIGIPQVSFDLGGTFVTDAHIGIPQVSFDPGGGILTDIEVEVHEVLKLLLIAFDRNLNVTPNTQGDVYRLGKKLKCHTEYSGTDCSTFLDMHPLMAIMVFLWCKGVAAALWLTLARSLNVRG